MLNFPGIHRLRTFRLTNRASLVAATVVLQAIVLGLGLLFGYSGTRAAVLSNVREQAIDEMPRVIQQFAARLIELTSGPLDSDIGTRQSAQALVNSMRLSNGAYIAIVDNENRLLCRPGIVNQDASENVDYSEVPYTLWPSGETLPFGTLFPRTVVAGRMEIENGRAEIAVYYIPSLHAKVMLVQPIAALEAAADRVMGRLGLILLALCGGVLGITALGENILVRRYDSMLMRINRNLEQEVLSKVQDGLQIRNALIFGLAKLADYRDTDTGKHLERISRYCELLANALRNEFPEIDDVWVERLRLASSLHDIGKVGIPDQILLKPGLFTMLERRHMEQHTLIGADTLVAIRRHVGHDDLLDMGIEVAIQHHERWDGDGYPMGLKGEEISLAARLVALADVYDAMTSRRVYKLAKSHLEARAQIVGSRGTHLDPRIVDAFERIHEQFNAARRELQPDSSEPECPFLLQAVESLEASRASERKAA